MAYIKCSMYHMTAEKCSFFGYKGAHTCELHWWGMALNTHYTQSCSDVPFCVR